MDSRKKLNKMSKILGFSINDDINGYAEGRGVSGLTGPEVGRLVDGGLDSVYLLFKKPAFKLAFKTPIPLSFTELNFQTELGRKCVSLIFDNLQHYGMQDFNSDNKKRSRKTYRRFEIL